MKIRRKSNEKIKKSSSNDEGFVVSESIKM